MARFSTCCIFLQNSLLSGKNKLAGTASTKNNNTLAMSHAFNSAFAVVLATTLSSMTQYSNDNLQRIFKIFLISRLFPASALAPVIAQQHKSS